MWALLNKEIATFFSSIIGYLVIGVFLAITGLFLWVIPGELNILYGGYATLEPLFAIAPWIFLFLVPAVTMRMFAEERRNGTLELLLTRPVTSMQIVLAKYLSGLVLVVIGLIPTLSYFVVVYLLGAEQGNLDMGAAWGSYIGLVFLAAIYVAIGVFASSITDNQIVAFVVAVVLCFVFYSGFDSLSLVPAFKGIQSWIASVGINEHYLSVSRGVLDSRDLVYFLSMSFLFIFLTRTVLESRKW